MPRVAAIQLFKEAGAIPKSVDQARRDPKGGLEGDWHTRDKREILVVDKGVLDDLGLKPGALREQVTIEGLEGLQRLGIGTVLNIGEASFEVVHEAQGCLNIGRYNGKEDVEAFRDSLRDRRGIYLTFTEDSPSHSIAVGDEVSVKQAASATT